jgi:hypothetical protein
MLVKMSTQGPALNSIRQPLCFHLLPDFIFREIASQGKLLMQQGGSDPDSISDIEFGCGCV